MSIDVKQLKRGVRFLHNQWLDIHTGQPMWCEVTCVRHGWVYWKPLGGKRSSACFSLNEADKRVKEIQT